eukprot:scaffold511566_cov18-Prasinocladus_malaysianus.AAC.1
MEVRGNNWSDSLAPSYAVQTSGRCLLQLFIIGMLSRRRWSNDQMVEVAMPLRIPFVYSFNNHIH